MAVVRPVRRSRLNRAAAKGASIAGSALLVVTLVFALIIGVGLALGQWRAVPVESGSMEPAIETGSLVLTVPHETTDLEPGQVVVYRPPNGERDYLMHRVVDVNSSGGVVTMETKGDANDAADPWEAEMRESTIWRARLAVPHLGSVIGAARSATVRFGLILAISSFFLISGLRTLLGGEYPHGADRRPQGKSGSRIPKQPPLAADL